MYTVIQWKTAASVLQSGKWANTTVEAKVRTIQKAMIPLLSRENAPARTKTSMTFSAFCLLFLLLLLLLLPSL